VPSQSRGWRFIVPPPAGYWATIQKVRKKHGILLIADDVVTGFGRLGFMFGHGRIRAAQPLRVMSVAREPAPTSRLDTLRPVTA
jgi:hypothetical protein